MECSYSLALEGPLLELVDAIQFTARRLSLSLSLPPLTSASSSPLSLSLLGRSLLRRGASGFSKGHDSLNKIHLVLILHMALTASKFSTSNAVIKNPTISKSSRVIFSFSRGRIFPFTIQRFKFTQCSDGSPLSVKLSSPDECLVHVWKRPGTDSVWWKPSSSVLCQSTGPHNTETKQCICDEVSGAEIDDEEHSRSVMPDRIIYSSQGLVEACKFAYNDAKFVSERARNDIVLLSRGIMRLDARAREDFAIVGLKVQKLDARAREDTEKIDLNVKKKAERVTRIASILKDRAQSRLKSAADKHWSDGALEADLRRADFFAKQRAMEDALMALEFMKDVHDMMVSKLYNLPLCRKKGSLSANDVTGRIMLEKNGRTMDFFSGEVSTDRITAIQEAYWSMASALSEADGIDYTDPEELELLVTALMDLDAMDGKSSVSLLAECSSSPDVNTRKALANALTAAPSMWTLGNAGIGALQRLAEDSNPAIAAAASRAIFELKKQWEIREGDSWSFTMDQKPMEGEEGQEADD